MSFVRVDRPSVPQHHPHSLAFTQASLPVSSVGRSLSRTRLPHQPAVSSSASRAVARQVRCQASPYSLDPSMLALEYQPLELPTAAVKTYDFLVLGSGIAGLTYALKVNSYGCYIPVCTVPFLAVSLSWVSSM